MHDLALREHLVANDFSGFGDHSSDFEVRRNDFGVVMVGLVEIFVDEDLMIERMNFLDILQLFRRRLVREECRRRGG